LKDEADNSTSRVKVELLTQISPSVLVVK